MEPALSSNDLRGLFKLPPELRVQIYKEVLCVAPFNPDSPQNPPLLTVCKLVRKEIWPIYEAHIIRAIRHYQTILRITDDLLTRADTSSTSLLERFKVVHIHQAVLDLHLEHGAVFDAQMSKLLLGPELGGKYTLEWKLKRLRKLA